MARRRQDKKDNDKQLCIACTGESQGEDSSDQGGDREWLGGKFGFVGKEGKLHFNLQSLGKGGNQNISQALLGSQPFRFDLLGAVLRW